MIPIPSLHDLIEERRMELIQARRRKLVAERDTETLQQQLDCLLDQLPRG